MLEARRPISYLLYSRAQTSIVITRQTATQPSRYRLNFSSNKAYVLDLTPSNIILHALQAVHSLQELASRWCHRRSVCLVLTIDAQVNLVTLSVSREERLKIIENGMRSFYCKTFGFVQKVNLFLAKIGLLMHLHKTLQAISPVANLINILRS